MSPGLKIAETGLWLNLGINFTRTRDQEDQENKAPVHAQLDPERGMASLEPGGVLCPGAGTIYLTSQT